MNATSSARTRKTYYYLHDHNKNVVGLIDREGNRVATYEYGPYGEITHQSGPMAEENPIRYSSEFYNSGTGLVEYLYRHYNPMDGRWLQRDPIAERGGNNLYGFVGNDPVNSTDKLGMGIFDSISSFFKWLGFAQDINEEYDTTKEKIEDAQRRGDARAEIEAMLDHRENIGNLAKQGADVAASTPGISINNISPIGYMEHAVGLAKKAREAVKCSKSEKEASDAIKNIMDFMKKAGYKHVPNRTTNLGGYFRRPINNPNDLADPKPVNDVLRKIYKDCENK